MVGIIAIIVVYLFVNNSIFPRSSTTELPPVTEQIPPVTPTPLPAGTIPMVRIPAGTFMMGSPAGEAGRFANEGPQRQVTLSAFYIGMYPVTQRQWQAVMGNNPSRFTGNLNRPVENVSWFDALVFANTLSILSNLSPVYEIRCATTNEWTTDPGRWDAPLAFGAASRWNAVRIAQGSTGYRLPTEAQWEFAARAGTTTAFNTGNNITTGQANFGMSVGATTPVGSFKANSWGLYDMHGNVWEWVWDWFGDYPSVAQTDPVGASSGTDRVLRGGSWSLNARNLRSAARFRGNPSSRNNNLGFRLARP